MKKKTLSFLAGLLAVSMLLPACNKKEEAEAFESYEPTESYVAVQEEVSPFTQEFTESVPESSEVATKAPSEASSEAPSEASSEASTEASTESAEKSTNVAVDTTNKTPASTPPATEPATEPSSEQPTTPTPEPTTPSSYAVASTEFVDYLNAKRREAGMRELEWSKELEDIALERAKEIASNFSHEGMRGCNGENILSTGSSACKNWYETWYNSEGHRNNMFNAYFEKTACAVYYANNEYHVVQIFLNHQPTKEEIEDQMRRNGDQSKPVNEDDLSEEDKKKIEKAIEDAKKKYGIQ